MSQYAYQQIVDAIVGHITDGSLQIGQKLPTTTEFCEHFGVSKITVRRAMDELAAHGLIARRRGSGTFVKALPMGRTDRQRGWNAATELGGFAAECMKRGMVASAQVCSLSTITPDAHIATTLALRKGEPCHRLERILFADDIACVGETSYVPYDLAPSLTTYDGETSLFSYLELATGQRIASSHRRIVATHPDEQTAQRMGIDPAKPVLCVYQTTYLEGGRPVEHSVALHTPGYEFYCVVPT